MKILFIYPKTSGLKSFIEKDAEILASRHEVSHFAFDRLRCDLRSLTLLMKKNDIVFNWFCGIHALTSNLIAKITGKFSVTVIGGYEVAKVDQINYGQFTQGQHSFITKIGLKLSSLILTVSKYSQKEAIENAKIHKNKVKLIYHGFSENVFKRDTTIKKKDLVLTIGNIHKGSAIKKGLELFIKSAQYLPEVQFILVGQDLDGTKKKLEKLCPPNVTLSGGIWGHNLAKICNEAKVYVQASIHESFGCSVAEAMLCGCLPVVSKRTALPEVVGNVGLYIEKLTPVELAIQIGRGLKIAQKRESEVIDRIRSRFPYSVREQKLLQVIESIDDRFSQTI